MISKDIFGPDKVTADLIYGRPGQTLHSWQSELAVLLSLTQKFLSLAGDHVSLYQLTVERGTKLFQQVQSNLVTMPNTDLEADFYDSVLETTHDMGYNQYEISSFGKNGVVGKHNAAYWSGLDYIGVGPGAHGRFYEDGVRVRTFGVLDPKAYIDSCLERGSGYFLY